MRIKPWYVQIQQNWAIFLQVYVTHFEYWLLSKFSHLTARQNKSRPGGEIFRIWTRGNNIFFPVKRENNGKTIFIWIAPKCQNITLHKIYENTGFYWPVFSRIRTEFDSFLISHMLCSISDRNCDFPKGSLITEFWSISKFFTITFRFVHIVPFHKLKEVFQITFN